MSDTTLWPLITAGFGIALVHAALPTHWLPFVLAGRAQKWSSGRTLAITAAAGGGHAAFTSVLGLLVIAAGAAVDQWSRDIFPWLAGAVLIGFGGFYLWKQWRGVGHSHFTFLPVAHGHDHPHHHHEGDCAAADDPGHAHAHALVHVHGPRPQNLDFSKSTFAPRSDRAVVIGLVTMLSLSPCEGFLPVFVAGAREGWLGYVYLSLALAAATLGGMLVLTWLTLRGLQHFNLERLSKYEHAMVGLLLVLMGLGVWLFET